MLSHNKDNKSKTFSRRMILRVNFAYYVSIGMLVALLLFIAYKNVFAISIGILMIVLGLVTVIVAILLYDMFIYIIGTMVDIIKKINRRNKND